MFYAKPVTAGYSEGTDASHGSAASEQHFTVLLYKCSCTLDLSSVEAYAVR